MAATLADILEGARCFKQCIPDGMQWPVAILLLEKIVNGEPPPDFGALVNQARCINSCIPPGMLIPVTIVLVKQIFDNPPQPGYPSHILTESGDFITTESGDRIVIE